MKQSSLLNRRVSAVIENEWSQLVRNKVVIFTTLVPPFLLVGLALSVLLLTKFVDDGVGRIDEATGHLIRTSGATAAGIASPQALSGALLNPFLVLFQMIPLIVPITIASYSIIGEKQSKSLEALLATPIRTWELLVGKALAAALPGVLATWYSFIVFVSVAVLLMSDEIVRHLILSPTWMISVLVLTPLFTLCAVGIAIIISSKVKDAQSAQQLGSLLVLPLVGALVAQATGAISLGAGVVTGVAVGLCILDGILFVLAVRLFRRESILTSWR